MSFQKLTPLLALFWRGITIFLCSDMYTSPLTLLSESAANGVSNLGAYFDVAVPSSSVRLGIAERNDVVEGGFMQLF